MTTASAAPANAATGRRSSATLPPGPYTTASVAPSPAPAAAPSRYRSASGLRKTPWYAAPAAASVAPTIAPSTTRGSLICHRIASSVRDSGEWSPNACANVPRTTSRTPRCTGPTSAPAKTAIRRKAAPPASQPVLRVRNPNGSRDRTHEVDDPRPPARRDRVVDADDRVIANRRDAAPAPTRGHGLGRLAAAANVGENDQRRVRRDDVLVRQLRIAGAGRVGRVGDVLQPEELVDPADERL